MSQRNSKARAAALRLLAARDRSVQELRERLEKRFTKREAEEAVNHLQQLGYLDDFRYAQNYVDYRNRCRPAGNYLLRLELRGKGVCDSIIDRVLNSEEQECRLALQLGKERLKRMGEIDCLKRKRRLYGVLERRGFSGITARRTVSELLDRDLENEYN